MRQRLQIMLTAFLLITFGVFNSYGQDVVKGTVSDTQGTLPGVSVSVKGTTRGIPTNPSGKYSIIASLGDTLIFNMIGFVSKEVVIGKQNVVDVIMESEYAKLEDVVVVGYGTQKKTSLTTAVSALSGQDLAKQSTSGDLRKTLQGMAPGLTILDNGGQPGDNRIQMQIRGVSSVNGGEPLVLVDGLVQSLNSIDPNSVESISILKDAASTAVYGSRGSNGIILVTTKKGKKGKLAINYESVYGLQTPTALPQFISTEEYLRFRNILAANEKVRNPLSNLPTYTEQEIQDYLVAMEKDPITNRASSFDLKDIYRPAPQTRHSLTLSGGGDVVQSMINMSYLYQEGTVWERNYKRINLRANNNINISKSLSGYLNLFYENSKRKSQATGNTEYYAIQGTNNQTQKYGLGGGVFYDKDGNYLPLGQQQNNPRLEADINYMGLFQSTPQEFTINGGLNWEPIKDLKVSASYALQNTYGRSSSNVPRWDLGFARYNNNSLSFNNLNVTRSTLNGLINYNKSFNDHNMSAMVGYTTEEFKSEGQDMYGQDFFNNTIRNISTGTQQNISINNSLNEWGLRGYFGRIAYNYDDRYYAEFSLRSDGSSRFPKKNRYSQFPGASAAWRISGEKFWKGKLASIVSDFKIRYSYGKTGSHEGVSNYGYIPQLNLNQNYAFSTGPGGDYQVSTIGQRTLAADELYWETVVQNNLGVDLGFLNNKLNVVFDVFDKTTNGILLDIPIPGVVGLLPSKTNAGQISNKGWEFSVTWRANKDKFKYNIGAGVASVEDLLTDYAGLGFTRINQMYHRWEGSPIYAIRGYKVLGIYQTDAEAKSSAIIPGWEKQIGAGDYRYEDVNGDGVIDYDNDAQLLGDRTPKYTFNLNLGANWKGIDMNMLWNGAAKVQTVLTGAIGEGGQYNNTGVTTFWRDNYWSKEGDMNVHFARPLWR
ncbi:MAG: SusC/RagA family TonB-linked outer membrane protein, partial [Segetibacter sp.]